MDLDHDDYQNGDFFKDWQEVILETAHRIVVCDRGLRCLTDTNERLTGVNR